MNLDPETVALLRQAAADRNYLLWLEQRGQGQNQSQPDALKPLKDYGVKQGQKYLKDAIFGSGPVEGANAMSQATYQPLQSEMANMFWNTNATSSPMAANAEFNALAQEAGGGISSAAEAPGMFDWSGIGSEGNALLPVAGLMGGINLARTDNPSLARGTLQGAASGAAMGSYFGAPGAIVGAIAGGTLGLGKSIFDKPSTRDIAKKHTKTLLGQGAEDPAWQSYVSGMRKQYDSAPPDPSKPFAGKYGSWEEYKKGGLEAGDLTGVYGNLSTFGPDWAHKSFDEQKKITQALIDAGLYTSKKGEVEITDPEKARGIAANLNVPAIPKTMIPRARTASPGFDKNGKRINYGR